MKKPITVPQRSKASEHFPLSRRSFLVAGGLSYFGMNLAHPAAYGSVPASPTGRRIAKSTIMIWLGGGASHIDTWDMKPSAPTDYRGPFRPMATSTPGINLCEYLPHLAKQTHRLAFVRSLGDQGRGTGDHHAACYYLLTGHAPDRTFHQLLNARAPYATDWPAMSAVVAAKTPAHPFLPNAITLSHKLGFPENIRPGQFGARLGIANEPVIVDGSRDTPLDFGAPAISLPYDVPVDRMLARRDLLQRLDQNWRQAEHQLAMRDYDVHQRRAFAFLASRQTQTAFDLRREPAAVREMYGPGINATSMLLARRLVEVGVPFVTVFWKPDRTQDQLCVSQADGDWDTHGNNFNCLKNKLLPEFDRPFAALLEDLHQRGLLDQTLVLVSSEMGRKPQIGDQRSGGGAGSGRDHWTACQTVLLAGAGVRGGQVYGSSDARAEYPLDNPVAPEHIARTVFHAMGIDDLHAVDREGRPFHLMEEGRPLMELF